MHQQVNQLLPQRTKKNKSDTPKPHAIPYLKHNNKYIKQKE